MDLNIIYLTLKIGQITESLYLSCIAVNLIQYILKYINNHHQDFYNGAGSFPGGCPCFLIHLFEYLALSTCDPLVRLWGVVLPSPNPNILAFAYTLKLPVVAQVQTPCSSLLGRQKCRPCSSLLCRPFRGRALDNRWEREQTEPPGRRTRICSVYFVY